MSVFFMLVLLLGCGTKAEPAENPYFEDDTEDDFDIFFARYEWMMEELKTYYLSTYYYDAFIYPFDYQTKDGYQPLPQQALYTKEDLSINDQIIDERHLFRNSGLFYAVDNDRFMYLSVLEDDVECQENTYCKDADGNFLHFSTDDDRVYFHYRVQFWSGYIYDYMYYFSIERDKLHLTFLHKVYNEYSLEVEDIHYVEYIEDEMEVNMIYDGGIFLSLYDIETGYIMEKELITEDRYGIRYYDVMSEIEYWTHFESDRETDEYVFATFFKNHRWAIEIAKKNNDIDYHKVRLNAFEGWDQLHINWIDTYPFAEVTLSNHGKDLETDAFVHFNPVLGDVFVQEIYIDINLLTSQGIYYEYDDEEIIEICDNFRASVPTLEYTYNLYQSNQELLDRFNEKTMSEFTFPLD